MTKQFERCDAALWRRTSDAVVILAPDADEAIVLSDSAVFVWESLGDGRDAHEVAQAVADVYGIDATTCEPAVAEALEQLCALGVVRSNQ